ncbi:MAG: 16S rRNA (guanine1207-N2)-methyltransferase [Gammaproteobacteria bacterium]|jgi:16S rRNA (guanine1207-N2)-methyltransferase
MTDFKEYSQKIRKDLEIHSVSKGHHLSLRTTWGLFSPRSVDDGSNMLLDFLTLEKQFHCLDLGCGYGVIGLHMAQIATEGSCLLVDKDFVAVDYADKNCKLNGLENVTCQLSNGFDQVEKQQFDVIVSNIPAKVGKEMLYIYLIDALSYLKPGGSFYIVTITGLRQFFKRGFNEVFGHYEKIKQGKVYTVARGIKAY